MSEDHPVVPWLTEKRRAWLYRLVTPAVGLLVGYGILDENTAALWAAMGFALLSGGTAVLNTSTKG